MMRAFAWILLGSWLLIPAGLSCSARAEPPSWQYDAALALTGAAGTTALTAGGCETDATGCVGRTRYVLPTAVVLALAAWLLAPDPGPPCQAPTAAGPFAVPSASF